MSVGFVHVAGIWTGVVALRCLKVIEVILEFLAPGSMMSG